MPEQLLVTIEEAGKMIRVGRTRMYELVAAHTIPSVRIGRSVRVPVAALRDWIIGELTPDESQRVQDRNGTARRMGESDDARPARTRRGA
jgi:excisionase family DNA binding protein